MTILLATKGWDLDRWTKMLSSGDPPQRVVRGSSPADLEQARYAVVWQPEPGLLGRCPRLEVIFNMGAGVDAILKDPTVPTRIPLVRIVDANLTMRMTEWIVMQVLLHHRQTLAHEDNRRQRIWRDVEQPAASAVSVGILGLGVLGQDAARGLRAIGFRVLGWSRSPREVAGVRCFHGPAGLDAMLAETDIAVCLLPLTPETRGLLDMKLFRKLRRDGPLGGPVVINAGRGGQQVERDILAALEDGTLKAVSLDVFETEPLPAESPFWDHPKVLMTPHVAADSEPEALSRYVLEQIARHQRGEPLQNVVDRSRGY